MPTQKSIQEIWDKIDELETQSSALHAQDIRFQGQLTSASVFNAISPAGLALSWDIRTVDSAGIVGTYNSLALGPDDQPAISYDDATNFDLKIARYNGNAWLATIVDSAGSVGSFTSLAFGPDGQPAISYQDGTNTALKIARYNGSVWVSTTVDNTGIVGTYTSLAFGPDGQPATSYYDNTSQDLNFARKGIFQAVP